MKYKHQKISSVNRTFWFAVTQMCIVIIFSQCTKSNQDLLYNPSDTTAFLETRIINTAFTNALTDNASATWTFSDAADAVQVLDANGTTVIYSGPATPSCMSDDTYTFDTSGKFTYNANGQTFSVQSGYTCDAARLNAKKFKVIEKHGQQPKIILSSIKGSLLNPFIGTTDIVVANTYQVINYSSGAITLRGTILNDGGKFIQVKLSKTVTDKGWLFETVPVWSDEFSNTGLPDTTKWSYDVGGNGWGNNELEYYTAGNNASVANGILKIEARKENFGGKNYTSARMVTKNKGDFLYGRFEMKAKLQAGRGLWPAIWMLPTDSTYGGWPNSGEIDIMEQVGYDPNNIHITIHDQNNFGGNGITNSAIVPTATTAYHIYRSDWTPYAIRGYIDSVKVFEFVNNGKGPASWPFDKRFHILLNLAIGGNWGGAQGIDDAVFPAKMEIEYVRVYKMINK